MIVFMISDVPPKIDWTRLSRRNPQSCRRAAVWCSNRSRPGSVCSVRAAAFAWCDLGGDHPPGDRVPAPQLPPPWGGRDDDAEPAAAGFVNLMGPHRSATATAADIPTIDADVDTELIAAQLPQILVMHDPSHGSQVRPCSRQLPGGNQDLGRGQHAHHTSMSVGGTR
jgi:hypothetical protein